MIEEFYRLNTPEELMRFMNKHIKYGWLDKDKNPHINTLKDFRDNYIVSSLDESLESGLGTCIEQTKIIKTFFDNHGYETKMYCHRRYEDDVVPVDIVRMHCFVLYMYDNKCYHFEHSNSENRGIHEFDSVEDAINSINATYEERGDIRVLTEIPDIIPGMTFLEFNQFVNQFEPTDLNNKKRLG